MIYFESSSTARMLQTAPLKRSLSEQHIERPESIPSSSPGSIKSTHISSERLRLSRSYSSTEYVRKHRRSPSLSKSFVTPASEDRPKSNYALNSKPVVRCSTSPLSNTTLPPTGVLSPPESNPNSSDEEQSYQIQEAIKLQYLEAAVRSIEKERGCSLETPSPETLRSTALFEMEASLASMKLDTSVLDSSALPHSKEGWKVSHSRSSTLDNTVPQEEEAITSSPEDSDRDDVSSQRPPMIRKKSGELVRPALRPPMARRRPSSMPGTPTGSKAVHFDSQLEHIRHFVQLDKPLAVSAEASPTDDYYSEEEFPFGKQGTKPSWELRLSNFPKNTSIQLHEKVRLEKLSLSSDSDTLVGLVAVANLAYHKHVAARFTFDHWRTVSEVTANYTEDIRRKHVYDGYDRFSFNIKLEDRTNLENKTLLVCIRYNVNGQEFWDNNSFMNYQAIFVRASEATPEKSNSPTSGSCPSPPRSRSFTRSNARSLSVPPSVDDFSKLIDRQYIFSNTNDSGHDADRDAEMDTPVRRDKKSRPAFSNRYDFEASLTAAIRDKPTHDRTTLTAYARTQKSPPKSDSKERTSGKQDKGFFIDKSVPISQLSCQVAQSEYFKPSSLINGGMHQDSSGYKELVDKYCFFGSSTSQKSLKLMASEGAATMEAPKATSFDSSQASFTPCSPASSCADSALRSSSRDSRTSLASPGSGTHSRVRSPMPLGHPYQPQYNSFLKESHSPAVAGI